MDFYFSQFLTGFKDELAKQANEQSSIFDIGGDMFPNITSQTKWQFARVGEHLQLHDGNHLYCFHLPEGDQEHDFPVRKIVQEAHKFGDNADKRGSAQIHRADPGSIYFTLQDGHNNPTYTFKHITGEQWRAIPKAKKHIEPQVIDKEAFLKSAGEGGFMDRLVGGIAEGGRGAIRSVMATGHDPLMSAGVGLLGGAAYDLGKRHLYNTPEENAEETTIDRLKRYLIPSAGLGLMGAMAKGTFPKYYSEFPEHRP
jgi:hypothetical protein